MFTLDNTVYLGKALPSSGGGGGADVSVDNETIVKSEQNVISTVGVKDQHDGTAIKTWTGTKEQYDAIVTKDDNTIYTVTDDEQDSLPIATPSMLGCVKVGSGLSVAPDGTLSSSVSPGADTSLSNLTNTGKIKSAHLAMPSGVKEELTWGSSNTKYTAPADGYFYATGGTTGSGSAQWVKLCNDSAGFCTAGLGVYGQTNSDVFITCSKGDEIYLYYSSSTNTSSGIFFIYANGSESEYTPS